MAVEGPHPEPEVDEDFDDMAPPFDERYMEDRDTPDPIRDYLESMDVEAYICSLAAAIPTLENVRVKFLDVGCRKRWEPRVARIVRREGAPIEIQKVEKTTELAIVCIGDY